jgi:polyisoprenoid-binding protein YceI
MYKLAFLLALIAVPSYAAPLKVKSSTVSFHATANPGFLSIDGEGSKLVDDKIEKTADGISAEVSALLTTLETGTDLRDEHMKEKYLETGKYPKAKLEFTGKSGKFTGFLTVKDEKKAVKGRYALKGDKLTAEFKISLKSYPAVGSPSWKLVQVGDEVTIKVSAVVQ